MPQTPPASQNPQDENGLNFGYIFGALWDHKALIIALTTITTLISIAYAMIATPVYRSDAVVQVETKSGGLGGSNLSEMLGEQKPESNAHIEILGTRMILGKAAEQVGLTTLIRPTPLPVVGLAQVRYGIDRPRFARGWSSIWSGEYLNISRFKTSQNWIGVPLTLRSLGEGRYELLTPRGESLGKGSQDEPFKSDGSRQDRWIELNVNRLTAPAGAEYTLIKRSELAATKDLQGRFEVTQRGKETGVLELSLTGTDPQQLLDSLNAVAQVYLTQNIERQAAEAEKSLAFLDEQVPQVRESLSEAENRLNRYRANQDSVDLSFETESALSSLVELEKQLNELELVESEMARRFTPSHPQYQTLLEKKEQLQREKEQLESRVGNLPETQQEILRLTRDVEVTQEIYVQLLNRMQELRIAKAGTVGNVRILDDAVIDGMIAPRRSLILAVGLFSGLLLSVCIVLLKLVFNRGVEAPAQLEAIGLPVYATVPLSDEQSKLVTQVKRRRGQQEGAINDLLAVRNPTDLSVEALRGLRTSLHFAMMDATDNRLMITGPAPTVGKSFVSVNLAAVCAQAGQKVLVIDGDMRKGHLHSAFQSGSENGLSELLAGQLELDAAITPSQVAGLDYIPRGTAPPNPSELLMQRRFTQLLDAVSARYDLVIIDTPPILAVTDAAIIGKQVSTALLVTRFAVNPVREVEAAMQRLESSGVVLKGAILNAMERKAATSYGYYGYYNYSYK
ncbi:polysaccharide biosynthesis tyrosine autokinase [Pistricoccus aurantiacus]|uniref:Polysaccharide biosynthesis tyrosine autokinase n=1 Tax=Pistricoccus aurantiacus TaxID=1883414 RepID=A0A5B8SSI7_9GAMM|nr:polysaccharide biosynthesis tyrosine autokinase [Pistricoccus aurantiacus]QEA40082.1 polysaccharide biosynthesis tyrosine autokinase [Pistricoccus aurantiacus]